MKRALSLCLTALLCLAFAAPALAEVLALPDGRIEIVHLPRQPHRGMSMTQVRQEFGPPQRRLPAVPTAPGYPTIHRWVYPGYIVYFANDYVIHTVVNQRPPQAAGTS